MPNADRFLDAFNQIEEELKRRKPTKEHVPFTVRVKASKDFTQDQKDLLSKGAEWRNIIVHSPRGGRPEPIAAPREDIVLQIERQLELLVRPPKALDVL